MSKGLGTFMLRRRPWARIVMLAALMATIGVAAHAHKYCKKCTQICTNSQQTGCILYYANNGVYTEAACDGGGTTCRVAPTTSCYTIKKICSFSSCLEGDCTSSACTTYPQSAIDAAPVYTGELACQ